MNFDIYGSSGLEKKSTAKESLVITAIFYYGWDELKAQSSRLCSSFLELDKSLTHLISLGRDDIGTLSRILLLNKTTDATKKNTLASSPSNLHAALTKIDKVWTMFIVPLSKGKKEIESILNMAYYRIVKIQG